MNDHEFLVFLLQISALLAAGILFGWAASRFRVPVVLGELIGGILLGPTLFGALAPGVHGWLFPTSGAASVGRQALTRIGMHTKKETQLFLSEEEHARHMHIVGRTGSGKSKLLEWMIREDIKAGRGLLLLDPHGDLYRAVLRWMIAERLDRRRLLLITR